MMKIIMLIMILIMIIITIIILIIIIIIIIIITQALSGRAPSPPDSRRPLITIASIRIIY